MNTKYQQGIIQILSRKTTTLDFLPFVSLVESEHLLISASKASTSSALCCRIEWVLGFWHFHLVYNLRPPFIIAQDPGDFPAQKKIEKSLHGRFGANAVDDDTARSLLMQWVCGTCVSWLISVVIDILNESIGNQ